MQQADILALAGLRVDGRRGNELRQLQYKLGLWSGAAAGAGGGGADGSCYLQQGLNKVLVLVHGPREPGMQGGRPAGDKVGAGAQSHSPTQSLTHYESVVLVQGSVTVNICHTPFSGLDHKPRRNVSTSLPFALVFTSSHHCSTLLSLHSVTAMSML
jgi:hypothetical protein